MAETFNVGLRFRKSEARTLRNVALRIRAGQTSRDAKLAVSLFEKAADAAANGEPLVVQCTRPEEAKMIAEGFTVWGIVAPNVVSLSG